MLIPFFGLVPAFTQQNSELDHFAATEGVMLIEETKLPSELPVHLDGLVVGDAEFKEFRTRWVGVNPQPIKVAIYNIRIHTPADMAVLDLSKPEDQLYPVCVVGQGVDNTYPVLTCMFGIDLIRQEELNGEPLV